ncbi:YqgE/AlgH family protein [Acidobacteria bacterium AH-259-O06]|nr:YqgE/AlgH family protein [Acidobacteria bacterium AH-259-O06]
MVKSKKEHCKPKQQQYKTASLAPGFLIAVPPRVSPLFHRSVILLIEHDAKGSMGLVLSNPTSHSVAELNKALKMCRRREECVFLGGPVELSLGFILHNDHYRGPDTKPIADGLALSTSLESMKVISEDKTLTFRCFIGYAGWGPSQLETEIADGKWLTCPLVRRLVFSPEPEKLWGTVLRYMGVDPMSVIPDGGSIH